MSPARSDATTAHPGVASADSDAMTAGSGAAAAARAAARARGALPPARLAEELARYALDKKAREVRELDMRGLVGYTDFFLICTGNTDRQVKAIHDAILAGAKHEHGVLPRRVEGLGRAQWVLMDYLDCVVHIFTPATREFYRLEQLWGEAPTRAVEAELDGHPDIRRDSVDLTPASE
jgi:ribosome-associated protein